MGNLDVTPRNSRCSIPIKSAFAQRRQREGGGRATELVSHRSSLGHSGRFALDIAKVGERGNQKKEEGEKRPYARMCSPRPTVVLPALQTISRRSFGNASVRTQTQEAYFERKKGKKRKRGGGQLRMIVTE